MTRPTSTRASLTAHFDAVPDTALPVDIRCPKPVGMIDLRLTGDGAVLRPRTRRERVSSGWWRLRYRVGRFIAGDGDE